MEEGNDTVTEEGRRLHEVGGYRRGEEKSERNMKSKSYRLHKVKHLPLLDLLHLEDVLQRNLIEVLPYVVHLVVRLRRGRNTRQVTY